MYEVIDCKILYGMECRVVYVISAFFYVQYPLIMPGLQSPVISTPQ
jgi:hypothetical protein